jgi:DNA replication and repair protein RecF
MIRRLQISNFRNYGDAVIELSKDDILIVLYGGNGEGKTNVLECLSLFSETNGLRQAKYDEMINKDSDQKYWNIIAQTDEAEFSSGYINCATTYKRVYKVNGKNVRNLSEFAMDNYVIWMTYETDRLFLQSPSSRRDFIDMFAAVKSEKHMSSIRSYERLTRERLKILKNHGRNIDVQKWLDVIEEKIAMLGIEIGTKRLDITKLLEDNQLSGDFPEFENRMIGSLESEILNLDDGPRLDTYKSLLRENREKDSIIGSTSLGPNRSDWRVISVDKKLEARSCSAGEQKMLLSGVFLSFVISTLHDDGRNLILLLDDVIAHLDADHRSLFFRYLKILAEKNSDKISIWLTGTCQTLFDEIKGAARFFCVKDNTITA